MTNPLYPIPVGPTNAELVTSFISRCKQAGLDFCPSDPTQFSPFSLFFYHIPRTGGLRFHQPVHHCILSLSQNRETISRLASQGLEPSTVLIQGNQDHNLDAAKNWRDVIFLSGRQSYWGCHNNLGQAPSAPPLETATFVRSPEARLKSAIQYLLRIFNNDIKRVEGAIADRHAYADNPLTRIFSGNLDPRIRVEGKHAQQAAEAVLQIDRVVHQENYSPARALQQEFISRNRLPNIICPSVLNSSRGNLSTQMPSALLEYAMASGCNSLDIEAYGLIAKSKPIPAEPATYSINSLHPLTYIFVSGTGSQGEASVSPDCKVVSTLDLLLGSVKLPDISHQPTPELSA